MTDLRAKGEEEGQTSLRRHSTSSLPVSVIVPVFNGERYLAEAIESILGQSQPPLEIILIDDGSRDGSAEIAESFGPAVSLHRYSNGGLPMARNRGVRLARGEFLAFLDADDLWDRRKLELQSQVFLSRPETEAVFGHGDEFVSPDLEDGERKKLAARADLFPAYLAGALLLRREALDRVGLFDEKYRVGEFIDWLLRAREKGLDIAVAPKVVLHRRLHRSNTTRISRDLRKDYLKVVRSRLERRRAGMSPDS